jgi:hypothetical protein
MDNLAFFVSVKRWSTVVFEQPDVPEERLVALLKELAVNYPAATITATVQN